MKAIGLDIGTTTICGVLWDEDGIVPEKKLTLPNDTVIPGVFAYEKLQDPQKILDKCRYILEVFSQNGEEIACIGVTGQMHGIVYVNGAGQAVSPLITWQDGRGELLNGEKVTWVQSLTLQTGYSAATGFGAVTHYYHTHNGKAPEDAASFCTIADYVAMQLAQRRTPLLHPSMAASLGLYDLNKKKFDQKAIAAAGMDAHFFPEVAAEERFLGLWQGKVPVSLGFGDNQASFLGAMDNDGQVLVNVGTGSQISILGDTIRSFETLECRPYLADTWLYVGASLCGGRAYALLKDFFERALLACNVPVPGDLYQIMNDMAREALCSGVEIPDVDVRFCGSRNDPAACGTILGLTPENFRPNHLTAGILQGICRELHEFYIQAEIPRPPYIVGSGNGLRNNPVMRELVFRQFGTELKMAPCQEEAACGAAKFALWTQNKGGKLICS